MCRSLKSQKKSTKTPVEGSRSFNVIGKLVSSACYDKQHVRAYLHRSHVRRVNSGEVENFVGGILFDALVGGKSFHPAA